MELAYTKSVEDVLEHFQVSVSEGLSNENVEKARSKHGLNGTYMSLVFSYGNTEQYSKE